MMRTYGERIDELKSRGISVFRDLLSEQNKKYKTGEIEEMYENNIPEIVSEPPNYGKRCNSGLSCLNKFEGSLCPANYHNETYPRKIHAIFVQENLDDYVYNFLK